MSNKAEQSPKNKSASLKSKLGSLLAKLPFRECLKQKALSLLSVALLLGGMGYTAHKAPEIHSAFLRYKVGTKVYMIKGRLDGGGGSGFAVKAPSGQSYIVTNAHVCEGALKQSEDKEALLVVNGDGAMRRRIIEVSGFTDLCVLEGVPGVEGLSLGDAASVGDAVTAVGHPKLRPLTLSKGEIIGAHDVKILDFAFPTGNPFIDFILQAREGKCDKPKNEIVNIPLDEEGLLVLKLCFDNTKGAYQSTVVIFPGNSGSPVVDALGRVVGVAFASDGTNWAEIVSQQDLERFLARY